MAAKCDSASLLYFPGAAVPVVFFFSATISQPLEAPTKCNGDFTVSHVSHSWLSLLQLHPLLTTPIYLVSNQREEVVRVFTSAPIAKRHDLFSLETTDGIYIIIRGFIDE